MKKQNKSAFIFISVPAISAAPRHNLSKLSSALGLHDISEREYLARSDSTIKGALINPSVLLPILWPSCPDTAQVETCTNARQGLREQPIRSELSLNKVRTI